MARTFRLGADKNIYVDDGPGFPERRLAKSGIAVVTEAELLGLLSVPTTAEAIVQDLWTTWLVDGTRCASNGAQLLSISTNLPVGSASIGKHGPVVLAASSFGTKRIGDGTPGTATPVVMIPSDVVIPPGILTVGSMVEIYWEITHTTASGNFDPVVYPVLSSYPNSLGCDGLRIQPGGAATERGGSGLLRFVVDTPTSQHILANPANLGDTGNPPQKTAWDVLNNGLNINLVSEFPANAPTSESVTLKYYSITIKKV